MCGIAGVAGLGVGQREVEKVAALLSALHHRGPDETVQRLHGNSVMGMTRLSIIDPERGQQPFYTADGQAYCVVNGEIYNHLKLRIHLETKGYSFRSRCDVEVIIHLYQEYGVDAFQMLEGMFAIAIFDIRRNKLLLVRDRFGEKPLAFITTSENLFFSSEVMPLVRVGCIAGELNHEKIFEYLFHGFVFEPGTVIRGVSKVEPGSWLEFDVATQRVFTVRYWSISSALETLQPAKIDIIESLSATMVRATQSDVPVAVALSGGIDSSAIAILGARVGRLDHAFSVSYENQKIGAESGLAEELANFLGLKFTHVHVQDADMVKRYRYFVSRLDEPIADPSGFGYLSIMEAVHAEGIKVLLTGHGGDELFFGYPWMRNALYEALIRERIGRNEIGRIGGIARSMTKQVSETSVLGMLKYASTSWRHFTSISERLSANTSQTESENFYRMMPQFDEAQRLFLRDKDLESSGLDIGYPSVSRSHRLDLQIIEAASMGYLRGIGINQCERLASSQSIELRLPLLDHPFVEMVLGLHLKDRALGLSIKQTLTDFIERELPLGAPTRKKISFSPPIRRWTRKLFATYGDLLNSGRLVHHNIINAELAGSFSKYRPGVSISNVAISLLLLEVWLRENAL